MDWLCLSVRPSVFNAESQDFRIGSSVFSDFFYLNKIRKLMRPDFWKKVPTVQEGPKSPINGPEMSFYMGRGGFWQKANPFICTFLLKYYCSNGFLTFRKNHMSGKNLFSSYCRKTSRPIRRVDSLNCNISQTSGGMKFYFRMWLDILRSNKYTTSFQVGVVRYVWSCPKWCQIVIQLDLKKEWVIKLFFCTGLRSDRSWNLI